MFFSWVYRFQGVFGTGLRSGLLMRFVSQKAFENNIPLVLRTSAFKNGVF